MTNKVCIYVCMYENGERDWGETLKIQTVADCPFFILNIRTNSLLLSSTGNSHWLNFDASCKQAVKHCFQQVIAMFLTVMNSFSPLVCSVFFLMCESIATEFLILDTFVPRENSCGERFSFVEENEKFVYQKVGYLWYRFIFF